MTVEEHRQKAPETEIDEILLEIAAETPPATLLQIGDISSILREEWYNEILDRLEARGRASGDITEGDDES